MLKKTYLILIVSGLLSACQGIDLIGLENQTKNVLTQASAEIAKIKANIPAQIELPPVSKPDSNGVPIAEEPIVGEESETGNPFVRTDPFLNEPFTRTDPFLTRNRFERSLYCRDEEQKCQID